MDIVRMESNLGYNFVIDQNKNQAWVEGNGLKSPMIRINSPLNFNGEDIKELLKKLGEEQHDLMDA